jgi:hypothetical protein
MITWYGSFFLFLEKHLVDQGLVWFKCIPNLTFSFFFFAMARIVHCKKKRDKNWLGLRFGSYQSCTLRPNIWQNFGITFFFLLG